MGNSAFITGGAKRIGRSIALFLAQKGWNIALHYNRSERDAEKTLQEIETFGVECSLFKADLSDVRQVNNLAEKVILKYPDCSLLINNASIFKRAHFLDTDDDIFLKMFNINYYTPFILMQKFSQNAKKSNQQFHIINILDTKISRNHTPYFMYSLTKKSLADLTLMAARDLGPQVRVNGICPGLILPSADSDAEGFERMKENIPLKMTGNTDYITKAVEFLIENSFVTGEIIYIDGGEHLGS